MAKNGAYHKFAAGRRRRRDARRTPRWLIALAALGGLFVLSLAIMAGVGFGVYQSYANDLIPPDEALAKQSQGGALVLDRNGKPLYQYLGDSGLRDPVPLDQISLYLVLATVAMEDTTFFDNPGINYKGLSAAAWDNFSPWSDRPGFLEGRGGSSITQQLVKNIYFTQEERSERSITRKLKETVYALELTKRYDKNQIMEWYLNQISYGNVYVGAQAASQGYFSKDAWNLTLGEAALLAAIPRCPSCYDPINNEAAAQNQRNIVLRRMFEEGYLTPEQLFDAAIPGIVLNPKELDVSAPHFVFNYVEPWLEQTFGAEAVVRDGLRVTTTLDLDWQDRAQAILEEEISAAAYTQGRNGALVAIDPKTEQILVYVGSRDYFNDEIQGRNDMAKAENSPGSAFKPVTYATAMNNLGWGPGSMILNTSISIDDGSGTPFRPRGPRDNTGPMTIREALGNSINATAVKAMMYAGVEEVRTQAKKMGLTNLDNKRIGPAFTTGGGDVRLIDLAYAYTVFPNLGKLKGVPTTLDLPPGNRTLDPIAVLKVEDNKGNVLYPIADGQPKLDGPVVQEEPVLSPEAAYFVSDILADPQAECMVFGCGTLSIPDNRPLAAKTGTSAPYANSSATGDTWTFAFTPQIVVGNWFGNADNSPLVVQAFSTTVSWPIVRAFMTEFHKELPVEQFQQPEGLVKAQLCVVSNYKPTSDCPRLTPEDYFAKSALPPELQGGPTPTAAPTPEGQQPGQKQGGDDPMWERVAIDRRSNKLASEITPPEELQYRFFLTLPADTPPFQRQQAEEWAQIVGGSVGAAPTERTTDADIPIAITSPANGTQVVGQVDIFGRARSSNFDSYRLEYSNLADPDRWWPIASSNQPVADGLLGTWDTRNLDAGFYIIRLIIVDRDRGEIGTQVSVGVVAGVPDPPDPKPNPTPIATPPGNGPGRPRGGPFD
ncbi:MAG: transglycosylase domain-containing protein [Dehalococcoidia bacterium]